MTGEEEGREVVGVREGAPEGREVTGLALGFEVVGENEGAWEGATVSHSKRFIWQ